MTSKGRFVRSNQSLLAYMMVMFVLFYMVTISYRLYNELPLITTLKLKSPDDISCYNSEYLENDIIQIQESYPPLKIPQTVEELKRFNDEDLFDMVYPSVFLILVSCESKISLHHACAIESAVTTHYGAPIYVFVTKRVNNESELHKILYSMETVKFVPIKIDKFVSDTFLKDIFYGKFMSYGTRIHARVTEILKIAILYKYTGVVKDINLISAKPTDYLGQNFVIKLNEQKFGNAIIGMNKHSPIGKILLEKAMQKLVKQVKNGKDVDSGVALFEAYKDVCYFRNEQCSDFFMHGPDYIFPARKNETDLLFTEGILLSRPFGYHTWGLPEVSFYNGSLYDNVMSENCPKVYKYMIDQVNTKKQRATLR